MGSGSGSRVGVGVRGRIVVGVRVRVELLPRLELLPSHGSDLLTPGRWREHGDGRLEGS